MATVDPDIELKWVEKAIADTATVFLRNPWQFHGDTGIMHYLYHRMLSLGGEDLFHRTEPEGIPALLFESEHYTNERYLRKGKKESRGRLDFAILDPDSITREGLVRSHSAVIAGIEVGLDKSVEKMGDMVADKAASSVRPGDAAKLIRGIRFGSIRHGFLLEFYRAPGSEREARRVFNAVLAAANNLAGFHFLVLVAGNENSSYKASAYPEGWKATIGLEKCPEIPLEANAKRDAELSVFERFQKHCGQGNLLLQARLRELNKAHPDTIRLKYSSKPLPRSMTVRRADDGRLLIRVSTLLDKPEELREIEPSLAQALSHAGLPVVCGRLRIPEPENPDFDLKVTNALKMVLGLPEIDEVPPQSATNSSLWDSLERLTGRIEAPPDWSAETDHYLYGVSKSNEDGRK